MISALSIIFCIFFTSISVSHDLDDHANLTSWIITTKSGESAKVSLHLHSATFQNSIQIEFNRTGCSPFEQMNLSTAAETNDCLRSRYGPDEMLLFVEGPSIQTFLFRQQNCTFYFNEFRIPIEGDYRIRVVLIRSNYSAVNELIDLCPQADFDVILDTQMHLTKTTWAPSTKKIVGYWLHRTPELSLLKNKTMHLDTNNNGRSLPISSWVNLSSNPVTNLIVGQLYSCAENVNNYEWKLTGSTDLQQVALTSTQGSAILSGKKILMIGDSHARTLSAQLISWACNTGLPDVRHQSTSYTVPMTASLCAGYHISFYHELFCGLKSLPPLGKYDLVIANCGHHPASARHTTLEEYRGMVTTLADEAILKGYDNHTFAWLESVPQPLRNDNWFIDYKDWRTYHRLDLFNQFSNDIMTRLTYQQKDKSHNGFTVISAFQNMLPFSDKLCDNAHYTTSDAYVPVYQSLLQLLNTTK